MDFVVTPTFYPPTIHQFALEDLVETAQCSIIHHTSYNPILICACNTLDVSEKLLVKEDAGLYHHINQGCLTVDGMDDKEEMRQVDVCKKSTVSPKLEWILWHLYKRQMNILHKFECHNINLILILSITQNFYLSVS